MLCFFFSLFLSPCVFRLGTTPDKPIQPYDAHYAKQHTDQLRKTTEGARRARVKVEVKLDSTKTEKTTISEPHLVCVPVVG